MAELLHENLLRSATRTPDQVAFRCGKEQLSYAELEDVSSRLAALLQQLGVRHGDRVALRLPPGIQSPISVYAVMKAGAAMVPIDPHGPSSRLCDILRTGDIRHLITNRLDDAAIFEIERSRTPLRHVIAVETNASTQLEFSPWQVVDSLESIDPVDVSPEDCAYVIFTSGSTGTPKGIVHSHRSGNHYARLSVQTYGVTGQDRIANLSPLHFDMSTFGYFSSVLAGATTVLVPPSYSMLPASLSAVIESERITIWYSVPFALVQLLQRGVLEKRDLSSVRWIMYGGEPLAARQAQQLRELLPTAWISNVYGPAEVNQCTYFHVPPVGQGGPDVLPDQPIPIGQLWNETEGRVIDSEGQTIEGSEPGELIVHSTTMMTRYWHSSSEDAATFYFERESGKRFYRTGDLVQRRSDGNLDFLGRIDRQVKIRGYRVELDEVEQALSSHRGVVEAAAFCVQTDQTNRLLAVVTVADSEDVPSINFRSYLAERIPKYAIPESVFIGDSFPRTTSGKIDRRALAAHYADPALPLDATAARNPSAGG